VLGLNSAFARSIAVFCLWAMWLNPRSAHTFPGLVLSSIAPTLSLFILQFQSLAALSRRGSFMFTAQQYRAKAAEYTALVKTARNADEEREFRKQEISFRTLADNSQWMIDNAEKIVRLDRCRSI
jgi:hypothetical protein